MNKKKNCEDFNPNITLFHFQVDDERHLFSIDNDVYDFEDLEGYEICEAEINRGKCGHMYLRIFVSTAPGGFQDIKFFSRPERVDNFIYLGSKKHMEDIVTQLDRIGGAAEGDNDTELGILGVDSISVNEMGTCKTTYEFYTAEKITPTTTCISDITKVHAFLIEGRDRAVLVDTCNGVGNLRDYIATITDKNVNVILTHGHCDHSGGCGVFDNVFLNKADWELIKDHNKKSLRKEYVSFCVPDIAANITDEDYVREKTDGFFDLPDGMTFDLGGTVLEMIALPGHTAGMTCVLNVTERYIIFGDGCNPCVFMWCDEALPIPVYKESLLKMKQQEDRYDRAFISHVRIDVYKQVLDEVIEVCDEIIEGRADNVPYKFMDFQGIVQAKESKHYQRVDGKLGNIVYRLKS